jgi:hypothetical protein
MNAYPDRTLRSKLAEMSKEDLIDLADLAFMHLRAICYSRNNFSVETMAIMAKAGKVLPTRPKEIDKMHKDAYEFLNKF